MSAAEGEPRSPAWPRPCPSWCAEDEDGIDPQDRSRSRWHRRRLQDGPVYVVIEQFDVDYRPAEPSDGPLVNMSSVGSNCGFHGIEDLAPAAAVRLEVLLARARQLLSGADLPPRPAEPVHPYVACGAGWCLSRPHATGDVERPLRWTGWHRTVSASFATDYGDWVDVAVAQDADVTAGEVVHVLVRDLQSEPLELVLTVVEARRLAVALERAAADLEAGP